MHELSERVFAHSAESARLLINSSELAILSDSINSFRLRRHHRHRSLKLCRMESMFMPTCEYNAPSVPLSCTSCCGCLRCAELSSGAFSMEPRQRTKLSSSVSTAVDWPMRYRGMQGASAGCSDAQSTFSSRSTSPITAAQLAALSLPRAFPTVCIYDVVGTRTFPPCKLDTSQVLLKSDKAIIYRKGAPYHNLGNVDIIISYVALAGRAVCYSGIL